MQKRHYIQPIMSLSGAFYKLVLAFVGAIFVMTVINTQLPAVGPLWSLVIPASALAGVCVSIGKSVYRKRLLASRPAKVQALRAQNGWRSEPTNPVMVPKFRDLSLKILAEKNDMRFSNISYGPDWCYADCSYGKYKHTKYGDTLTSNIYYAIASIKLPRELPHVMFDSLRSHKRQFRFVFAASQRHSLEGDFDKYFATYLPNGYSIDGLSFITPEVMQALIDAADYDIEIVKDELIVYGPMYQPELQIAEMIEKVNIIKTKLLHNIVTYRDERLDYEKGRQTVSLEGIELKRSLVPKIVSVALLVFYILLRIYFNSQ
jgi:hypothetical protein